MDLNSINSEIEDLKSSYKEKREIYKKLLNESAILTEDLEIKSYGIYEPHFDFDNSERFKVEIKKNKEKIKELIKEKTAIICDTDWVVLGSRAKGKTMTNKNMKLMLRAFNGECDSLVGKVKWNNIEKIEARIKKAFEAINKMGEETHIYITPNYLGTRLKNYT